MNARERLAAYNEIRRRITVLREFKHGMRTSFGLCFAVSGTTELFGNDSFLRQKGPIYSLHELPELELLLKQEKKKRDEWMKAGCKNDASFSVPYDTHPDYYWPFDERGDAARIALVERAIRQVHLKHNPNDQTEQSA